MTAQRDPVWRAIATKRMIRDFEPRPLEPDHLDRILNAGRRAASSKNQQRWALIVVEDRNRLRELANVGRYAGHLAGAAAGVALVTPDPRRTEAPLSVMWDLGQMAGNMMLVAWELRIGSVPATVYDQGLTRRILAYPEDQHCEFILSFGYPANPDDLTRPPAAGGRVSLEEILHREQW